MNEQFEFMTKMMMNRLNFELERCHKTSDWEVLGVNYEKLCSLNCENETKMYKNLSRQTFCL